MTCYLQLTLADAERIVRENDRQYWAEARLMLQKTVWFNREEPDYAFMTFVRVAKGWRGDIRAQRGQMICVMKKGAAPAMVYGGPLTHEEPLVTQMRVEQLLARVGQPQASRKPMGGGVLPLFNQPKRKDRQ